MPQLPSSDQLGVRTFQNRSQVVTPQIDTSGQRRLTDTIVNVSDSITERMDQSALQKAKILFQKKKLEADNAFEKDTDFETYESRYDEMLSKAAEDSAKLIRGQRRRDAFNDEISLYRDEGKIGIRKKALARETEKGIADLDESLTLARENYLRATEPADRQMAQESLMEAIDFAESASYIDSAKAQDLRKSAAVDLAIASVKIESPENQVKLLKENKGLIDVIPMDTRVSMIQQAQSQFQNNQALAIAGTIKNSGGDLSTRMGEADKITDVKLRENVKEQIQVDFNREKVAKAETQYSAYDTIKKGVIEGKSSLEMSTENPELWNVMSADQQQAVRSMDKKQDRPTDINVYNNLNRLARTNKNSAYEYFLNNADKLSNSDAQTWSDRLAKPEELDSFISNSKILDTALMGIGVKDKKSKDYAAAVEQMNQDYVEFQKDNGRKPNADEVKKIAAGITDQIVDGSWNPFVADVYGYELTPTERKSRSADKKVMKFEALLDSYKKGLESQGRPTDLSDDEVNKLYMIWDNKGRLDDDIQ